MNLIDLFIFSDSGTPILYRGYDKDHSFAVLADREQKRMVGDFYKAVTAFFETEFEDSIQELSLKKWRLFFTKSTYFMLVIRFQKDSRISSAKIDSLSAKAMNYLNDVHSSHAPNKKWRESDLDSHINELEKILEIECKREVSASNKFFEAFNRELDSKKAKLILNRL